jgi:hypothetical protein
VMIFSATGRAAFARVSVVVIRPCSNKLFTRFRSVARRCDGLRPSFDPELRCRIVYPFIVHDLEAARFQAGGEALALES